MATKDGFPPDDRFPVFLSEHAEETGQPDIGKAWDIAIISSRILKTSIVAVTVTAIGIAILSIGNPVALVANVTDWWVDKSALQPGTDPSTSTIQSSPALINQSPALRICRRPQRMRRRATKLLRLLNLPIRAKPSRVKPRPSHSLKPCSSNSRLGRRRKRHGHRSSPHNPCKLPLYRSCKMPQRRSGP